jgi:hypothetical protein
MTHWEVILYSTIDALAKKSIQYLQFWMRYVPGDSRWATCSVPRRSLCFCGVFQRAASSARRQFKIHLLRELLANHLVLRPFHRLDLESYCLFQLRIHYRQRRTNCQRVQSATAKAWTLSKTSLLNAGPKCAFLHGALRVLRRSLPIVSAPVQCNGAQSRVTSCEWDSGRITTRFTPRSNIYWTLLWHLPFFGRARRLRRKEKASQARWIGLPMIDSWPLYSEGNNWIYRYPYRYWYHPIISGTYIVCILCVWYIPGRQGLCWWEFVSIVIYRYIEAEAVLYLHIKNYLFIRCTRNQYEL